MVVNCTGQRWCHYLILLCLCIIILASIQLRQIPVYLSIKIPSYQCGRCRMQSSILLLLRTHKTRSRRRAANNDSNSHRSIFATFLDSPPPSSSSFIPYKDTIFPPNIKSYFTLQILFRLASRWARPGSKSR